jgi:Protein of unknown function (DUF2586)
MALPDVKIKLSNGNLGRVAPSEDGTSALIISGVAVSGKFALDEVLGPFVSELDAQAKGINEAYDVTNATVAYKHILDFFEAAGRGTKLYVMVVAKTITMDDMTDYTLAYAKKMLAAKGGDIKLIGITRVPQTAYVPTFTAQLEDDVISCVQNAQELYNQEVLLHRPVRFIVEGRNWQGNSASTLDLRGATSTLNANAVVVVLGNDTIYANARTIANKYASVGMVLGRAAKIPVQRNLGRIKDGAVKILNAGYSNGAVYNSINEGNVEVLNDKGYVFFKVHAQKSGFFINDDHTACLITDDYAQLSLGRVIDKVSRITRKVYIEELLDEIDVDPTTGKIGTATMKHYEGIIEEAVNREMTAKGEIVSINAYIDPNQNVLATSKISILESIVPKGIARKIESTLAYDNPSTN